VSEAALPAHLVEAADAALLAARLGLEGGWARGAPRRRALWALRDEAAARLARACLAAQFRTNVSGVDDLLRSARGWGAAAVDALEGAAAPAVDAAGARPELGLDADLLRAALLQWEPRRPPPDGAAAALARAHPDAARLLEEARRAAFPGPPRCRGARGGGGSSDDGSDGSGSEDGGGSDPGSDAGEPESDAGSAAGSGSGDESSPEDAADAARAAGLLLQAGWAVDAPAQGPWCGLAADFHGHLFAQGCQPGAPLPYSVA
jgi:hypothetical protein